MYKKIAELISILKKSPPMVNVFNPWRDVDAENDFASSAPGIRARQLGHYLETRIGRARYAVIGEAIGYQGGHFTGIAMTSERIILGYKKEEGIYPKHVLSSINLQRTSKRDLLPQGFSEPTATIVWGTLLKLGLDPREFVLWNAFPWHPFDPHKGMLSNRKPMEEEMKHASLPLGRFLEIFPHCTVISLGKTSCRILKSMGVVCFEVRHPANGGAGKFRAQILEIFKNYSQAIQ